MHDINILTNVLSEIDSTLSLEQIANKYSVSYGYVRKLYIAKGVNFTERTRAINRDKMNTLLDSLPKESLITDINNRIVKKDILTKYNITLNTFNVYCKRENIDIKEYNIDAAAGRTYKSKLIGVLTREVLQKYTDQPTSINKIADILNVDPHAVKRYLKKFNIDRKECNRLVRINSTKILKLNNVYIEHEVLKHCKTCDYRKSQGQLGSYCDYACITGVVRGCKPSECSYHKEKKAYVKTSIRFGGDAPLGIDIMSQT